MTPYEIREIPIEELKKAGYNPRKNLGKGDPEYEGLRRSIEELGMIDSLVWNKRTGTIVGGHQRLTVLADLGYQTAPCFVVNLSPEQEKQANVRLNSIKGAWDYDKLAELIPEFTPDEINAACFDPKDLQALYACEPEVEEDEFDEDEALAAHETPTTKLGDIILLGEHRLLCGDATKKTDADRLMNGRLADITMKGL
jgi:ParB-like chromosome segregation protein Spo0J